MTIVLRVMSLSGEQYIENGHRRWAQEMGFFFLFVFIKSSFRVTPCSSRRSTIFVIIEGNNIVVL